jgi:patatin-like phospholipase/acyl hydrolase
MERLSRAVPGWLPRVRLLAGTSTGGIIALGLARGLSLAEIRELYEKKGRVVFDDSWMDDLADLGQLRGAQYGTRGLGRELRSMLGDVKLRELKKRVLIPAFDLDNEHPDPNRRRWTPKFFHNSPGPDSDGEQLAYKVALYTSAAPTYFPSVDGYVDGGVVANNPSMAALAQTRDPRAFKRRPSHDRVVLLSIGTGQSLVRVEGRAHDWGYLQWAKPLVNIMLDGMTGVADYQCRQILGDRYFRVDPVFPADKVIPLDAIDRIPEIIDFAESVDLSHAAQWLKTVWQG